MNREVLQALIPSVIALAIAFVMLRLVIRFSGAKLELKRLKKLHDCEHGGVQSLSFVLTLPLFIMIVMFIVQVSQLMLGLIAVHYSAFAAARSAVVWSPARFNDDSSGYRTVDENELQPPLTADNPLDMEYDNDLSLVGGGGSDRIAASAKLNKIFSAAVMGVAPVSPSRRVVEDPACTRCGVHPTMVQQFYQMLVPESSQNSKIPVRLLNKMSYAYWNTRIRLSFVDKDSRDGPTYNPRVLRMFDGMAVTDRTGDWVRDWTDHEIGWEDPITITVEHDFALLPGPGRFLAKYLVRQDGNVDQVAPRIETRMPGQDRVPFLEPTYTIPISASATLTNEGLKPLLRYEQNLD
jgi:hypothetical protein